MDNLPSVFSKPNNLIVSVELSCDDNTIIFNMVVNQFGIERFEIKNYVLLSEDSCVGLFNLLNDYFNNYYQFFNSSKSVQAFILALLKANKEYTNLYGLSFNTLCKIINNANKQTNKDYNYKCFDESSLELYAKSSMFKTYCYLSLYPLINIVKTLISEYKNISNEIEHYNSCSILISDTDETTINIISDISTNKPLLCFHRLFEEYISYKIAQEFLHSYIFKLNNITQFGVKSFDVAENRTIKDIEQLGDDNLEITSFDILLNSKDVIDNKRYYVYNIYDTFDIDL